MYMGGGQWELVNVSDSKVREQIIYFNEVSQTTMNYKCRDWCFHYLQR
jgi:hypothetical protein